MNGNKMIRVLAAAVCAFMLISCTAFGASAAEISPEAQVVVRPEVVSAVGNQIGVNYLYISVVTENSDNDQTVMAYLLDDAGNLVGMGYTPIGSNKAEIKIGVPDSAATGTYETVVALNKAKKLFKSNVFYVGTEDVEKFFETINLTDVEWSEVYEKIEKHYHAISVIEYTKDDDGNIILKLTGEDYENLSDDGRELFARYILNGVNGKFSEGKGKFAAENSENFIKEAYFLAQYNAGDLSDEKLAEHIYRFASVVGFDAEDNALYGKIQNRDSLAKVVRTMAPEVDSVADFAETFEKAAAVQIVNETHWLNLVQVVSDNNDLFDVDESEIKALNKTKKLRTLFCEEFKGQYYSVSEIQKGWRDAYKSAKKAYDKLTSGGGGTGGTGTGGNVTGNLVSTTIDQSENNKDKNVKVEEYYNDIGIYSWASDAILNLTKNSIVAGYGDMTFRPANSVTRAEFMKMVVNVFGLADITATSTFEDVNANDWYYIYVASAEKLGIAQGYGNGLFGVNDPVTRQDAITMVYRAAQIKGLSVDKFRSGLDKLADKNDIAIYAYTAVETLYNTGVYLDASDPTRVDMFEPTRNASRAYLAVILNQLYMFINN